MGTHKKINIRAGVLQGDTLAQFHHGLTLQKARCRRYPPKKINDADYADDRKLCSKNAERLLNILEKTAAIIGLHVNAENTYAITKMVR